LSSKGVSSRRKKRGRSGGRSSSLNKGNPQSHKKGTFISLAIVGYQKHSRLIHIRRRKLGRTAQKNEKRPVGSQRMETDMSAFSEVKGGKKGGEK